MTPGDGDHGGLVRRTERGVLWLTIDRPEVGNSFDQAVQEGLVDGCREASASSEIRAVLLTASGDRHFCTGPDLSDPAMRPSPDRAPGDATRALRTGSQRVVAALLDCEKPIVCGLNGLAAGGGANLVLACDLVVAADHARIIEIFARRGLAPDGGAAYLLTRRLPLNVAKELVMLGDELSADEAHRLGLVNRVVPSAELPSTVADLAGRLAAGPTRALAAAKAMLNRAADLDRAAAFEAEALLVEQVAATRDVAEGMAAFADRREPRFEGR